MKGYQDISRILLPRSVAHEGHKFLRLVGERGAEGMVLWIGALDDTQFKITDLLIPRQRGIRTEDGICVLVESEELRRINLELYHSGLRLIAQVHSHPGLAYHSDTDDSYAVATTVGSLSLVVPDFARRPFALSDYATYRLSKHGAWWPLSSDEARNLIVLLDS